VDRPIIPIRSIGSGPIDPFWNLGSAPITHWLNLDPKNWSRYLLVGRVNYPMDPPDPFPSILPHLARPKRQKTWIFISEQNQSFKSRIEFNKLIRSLLDQLQPRSIGQCSSSWTEHTENTLQVCNAALLRLTTRNCVRKKQITYSCEASDHSSVCVY